MIAQPVEPSRARTMLNTLFAKNERASYLVAMKDRTLNSFIPGLERLEDCDQGTAFHLEGNVAIHTALVLQNLVLVCSERMGRLPTFVEYLAALIHDLKKPDTRYPQSGGLVTFPDHEEMAGREAPAIAGRLGLNESDTEQLTFVVRHHGDAHNWLNLEEPMRMRLKQSPWIAELALLQEADALSCQMPVGRTPLPVFRAELLA